MKFQNPLKGKKILIGICGGIAAFKIPILVRMLVKKGCEVRVVMTTNAKSFVTPLTLATLSNNEVFSDFYDRREPNVWNNHVELGMWADVFLIAPATANTLSKMAHGICDNLLLAVYLSCKCSVFVAPAMDLDMYKHPSVDRSLALLKIYGNHIIDAKEGFLASGLHGKGRMAEPQELLEVLKQNFAIPVKESFSFWQKQKVLITAGPTYEAIDPVRFIGNRSSGKMGIALTEQLLELGAQVVLVLGPCKLELPNHERLQLFNIESASEMSKVVEQCFSTVDIAIAAAAVADYTPKFKSARKIKKKTDEMSIVLEPTKDILRWMGKHKTEDQYLVGFALETQNGIENATSKLQRKNLDLIVLNSLEDSQAGFGYDTNKITLIDSSLSQKDFSLKPKPEVAKDILNFISSKL